MDFHDSLQGLERFAGEEHQQRRKTNLTHEHYRILYNITPTGERYALYIQDRAKVASFLNSYPASSNFTAGTSDWTTGSPTQIAYNLAYNAANPAGAAGTADVLADEMAQAYMLDHFNTGIVLLKPDSYGNFKELHAVRTVDANGTVKYSLYNCN